MEYKNFNSYKIDDSNIMDINKFSKFESDEEYDCEYDIFELYPNHLFIFELESGRCYSYSKKDGRKKYWDIETVESELKTDIKDKSLISTKNGQFIKKQYENLSGLVVKNIYMLVKNKKSREDRYGNRAIDI